MRVAVTGTSGLLGGALVRALEQRGDEVLRLVRRRAVAPNEVGYDPETDLHDPERLEGCRVVVHLAGADPGARAWSGEDRALWRRSRYEPTRKLCQNVSALRDLPEVFVSASSLAFYGDRGDEVLDERSARGAGDLAEFVEEWESASEMVEAVGMRLVWPRFAPVVARGAGLVAALTSARERGVGPLVGDGRHRVAWIGLDDAVRALVHLIETPTLERGVVVARAEPTTQAQLARMLFGESEHAPMTPERARAELGDDRAEAWCAGRAAHPAALLASGFVFSRR